jgi:hypothetical protein
MLTHMKRISLVLTMWVGAVLCAAQAAAQPGDVPASRDFSGFWELRYDGKVVPAAKLIPKITPQLLAAQAKRDAHNIRYCNVVGTPFIMDLGRPLNILIGTTAVIVQPESVSNPRFLYFRDSHVGDVFDPATNGDSIARWDGDTLVVDTVGFHERNGILMIPGGGYRTPTSRLVERYRLLENGAVLSVTFTWTDPNMYQAPHTYEYRYYRLPAYYEPLPPSPCDPYNESRAAFLEGRAPAPAAR